MDVLNVHHPFVKYESRVVSKKFTSSSQFLRAEIVTFRVYALAHLNEMKDFSQNVILYSMNLLSVSM